METIIRVEIEGKFRKNLQKITEIELYDRLLLLVF